MKSTTHVMMTSDVQPVPIKTVNTDNKMGVNATPTSCDTLGCSVCIKVQLKTYFHKYGRPQAAIRTIIMIIGQANCGFG